MQKTRLNQRSRNTLERLANRLVTVPDHPLKVAYDLASALVRNVLEKRYPPADMEVLRRYDLARQDPCVRLRLSSGGDYVWNLPRVGEITWQGSRYCTMHAADKDTTSAFTSFEKLKDVH